MAAPMVIWKTALRALPIQEIMIPAGAKILCAREQHRDACIWYTCDPDAPKVPRKIAIAGTGHSLPKPLMEHYLGTASLDDGHLILHVFEIED